jgi:Peptidase MA superfamily
MKRLWTWPFSLLMVWMALVLGSLSKDAYAGVPPAATSVATDLAAPAAEPVAPLSSPPVTAPFFPPVTAADPGDPGTAESPGATFPRDVAPIIQPGAATLGDLPPDFERIEAGWIVFEFPSSVRARIEPLVKDAEEFRSQLSADLGQPVLHDVRVRIARNPEQMAALAPRGSPPFGYAVAMTYPSVRLLTISLVAPQTWEATDLQETFRHELTHLALFDGVAGQHLPRWFDEGFAVHESGELAWKRYGTLFNASLSHMLLPVAELDRATFPSGGVEVSVAYAESADLVRFLMRDGDRARFGSLIERVRAGVAFDRALEDAYGTSARVLEYQWREELGHRVGLFPAVTGGSVLWVLIVGLSVAALVEKRRRAKEKLAQWAREEAEAMAVVPAASADAPGVSAPGATVPPRIPSVPIVEHEGRWYTLH